MDACLPAAVRETRAREKGGVAQLARESCGVEQHFPEVPLSRLPPGLAQPDQQTAASGPIRVAAVVVQLERLPEPSQRLVWREVRKGALTRASRVVDCLVRVIGRRRLTPVMGELRETVAWIFTARLLHRFGDPPVQPGAPRAAELLVEGVVDQGMSEGEAPHRTARLVEDGGLHRLVEQVEELVLFRFQHAREQVDVELAPDHRRNAERTTVRLTEALDASSNDLAHALRKS